MSVLQIILIYLVLINVGGFLVFGIDKSRSVHSKWRIPEATLFSYAIFGGSVGCLLGMRIFRHKTLKPYFVIGIPAILIIQLLLVLFLLFLSPVKITVI